MVSKIYSDKRKDNTGTFLTEFDGLSSDTKPEYPEATNADIFYEMNTGSVFKYDQENKTWIQQ